MCAAAGQPVAAIGSVTPDNDEIDVAGLFSVSLGELRDAYFSTLEKHFGNLIDNNTATE
jgi:hypothetical protein